MPYSMPEIARIVGVVLAVLCVIHLVFLAHRDPFSTIAWLVSIVFVPVVGLVFYIFFGVGIRTNTNRMIRKKVRADKEIAGAFEEYENQNKRYMESLKQGEIALNDPNVQNYLSHIGMHYHMGGNLFSQNNNVTIYTDAIDHYESLLADIREAKSSINLLYFIFNNDEIGNEITNALTEKAKEGVEVRLCIDAIGSFLNDTRMFQDLKKAGGKVSLFNVYYLFNIFNINYRNHRKIAVIDGIIGYTGGINIGDEYMGLDRRITPWRDTHLRITGAAVLGLQEQFVKDWYSASRERAVFTVKYRELFFKHKDQDAASGTVGMQIISSGPDSATEQIKRAIIKIIASAQNDVFIQTPYYIPDPAFTEAILTAAMSGVRVSVMLPGVPDKKMVYRVTKSSVQALLDCGARVYLYPGFLHAKMVVADDSIATIGTCNMDMRSFRHHYEVNCMIYDSATAKECREIFDADALESHELTKESFAKRSVFDKMSEQVFRLFTPLL